MTIIILLTGPTVIRCDLLESVLVLSCPVSFCFDVASKPRPKADFSACRVCAESVQSLCRVCEESVHKDHKDKSGTKRALGSAGA